MKLSQLTPTLLIATATFCSQSSHAALTMTQVNGFSHDIYGSSAASTVTVSIAPDSVDSLRGQTFITNGPSSGEAGWDLEYVVLPFRDYSTSVTLGVNDVWELTIVEWDPNDAPNDSSNWTNGTSADPLAGFTNPKILVQESGSFATDTEFYRIDYLKFTLPEGDYFMEGQKAYAIYLTNKGSADFSARGADTNTVSTGAMLFQAPGESPVMLTNMELDVRLHGSAIEAPDDRDIAPRFSLLEDIELPLNSPAYSAVQITNFDAHNDGQSLVGYSVSNDADYLFSIQPDINNSGILSFTPAQDISGTAIVSVYAIDDGASNNQSIIQTFTITITDRPAQIVYVDINTPAIAQAQDGTTWGTAFASLQDALASAVELDEIWIADGIYYPDAAPAGIASITEDNRNHYFQLLENVPTYGGFSGDETSIDERLPKVNRTILSGDIDQNDITFNGIVLNAADSQLQGNNSYEVVRGLSDASAYLDGVIITAGNGGVAGYFGGGELRSCVIQGNTGYQAGGIYAGSTSLTLVDCELYGNTNYNAGGLSVYNIDLTMVNCRVQGNTTTGLSSQAIGGLKIADSSAILTNCLISGNVGTLAGGVAALGYENFDGNNSLTIENCTISGNYATGSSSEVAGGLSIATDISNANIYNSIIWGNDSTVHTDANRVGTQASSLVEGYASAGTNLDGTDSSNAPDFIIPLTASATASTEGDFRLSSSSPALSAGQAGDLGSDRADLDADDDTSEALPYDIDGNQRVQSTLDLGAFEYTGSYSALDLYRGSIGLDTDGSEDDADSSGNGVPNILNYAFGFSNPDSTDLQYADPESASPGLPSGGAVPDEARYQITYVRSITANNGITTTIECSSDLLTWVDVTTLTGDAAIQETTVTPIDDDYELVTLEFNANTSKSYYRAKVTSD